MTTKHFEINRHAASFRWMLIGVLAVLWATLPGERAVAGGLEECDDPPVCSITPDDGPFEVFVGEPFSVTICAASTCGGEVQIESFFLNPGWCAPINVRSSDRGVAPGEELCIDLVCTPPITAAIGESRTFRFKITDLGNGEVVWCEYEVMVTLPCIKPPQCHTIPEGVVEVPAGDEFSFDFCVSSDCEDHRFLILPEMVPDWCQLPNGMINNEMVLPEGERCFTIDCSPPSDTPQDRYWIKLKIIDLETGLQDICVIDVDITEPVCDEQPKCEIFSLERAGNNDSESFKVTIGETGGFQICGTSFCGNDVEIDTSDLPDFCAVGPGDDTFIRTEGYTTECVWIDCDPQPGDAGLYQARIWVTDLGNGRKSRCDVTIEVNDPCDDEQPFCQIIDTGGAGHSDNGDLRVQVGEPFAFEVCGDAACDDHRVKVEPSGLPPFVNNPGHMLGDPGEEVCLEVTGEARPTDVGYWNVRFKVTDVDSGLMTECSKRIIVEGAPVCDDRPICTLDPDGEIEAQPGSVVSFEICGTPVCEGHAVEIVAESLPDFCDAFTPVTGEPGQEVCAMVSCAIPDDIQPGVYELQFRVRDTTNLLSRLCTAQIVVPAPAQLGCFEGSDPNGGLAQCTMFDVDGCFDTGCGASITGMLDQTGEDFDYYCVGGLDPF